MKKILSIAILVFLCSACANKSTVNILISNEHPKDTANVTVQVPVDEILSHLDVQVVDSLTLLNEKNQQVQFVLTHDKQRIEFVVPIVKGYSQKNYSLNTNQNKLSDNLFSFRTTSINVDL